MSKITLRGAHYSVYTRIIRLLLEELGLAYRFQEVDIFDKETLPEDYAEWHPFSRIPAIDHNGFRLYESDAIAQYLLALTENSHLLPADAKARARVVQLQRIADHYAYPHVVWGIYVKEKQGQQSGAVNDDDIQKARRVLQVLEDFLAVPYFCGDAMSLADLWVLPMLAYARLAPTGAALLRDCPKILAWLEFMNARASVAETRFPVESEVVP